MKTGWEILGKERPDGQRSEEIGAVRELARSCSTGQQDVNEIGKKNGPEKGYRAQEEEDGQEQSNAQRME